MAYVAGTDLPWTEIVTSDVVMTNDLLVNIFPIEYVDGTEPPTVESLVPADMNIILGSYQDGRPPVGVLSTNGLWWRYQPIHSI